MSDILIKGLEMPKHCIDCPFMVSRDNDDCILQSAEANESFENWEQMKAGCPLVPVPPHGRLIDADKQDAQIEALIERHLHGYTKSTWDFVCELRDILKRNPTIIPAKSITAEEEKNDK